MMIETRSTATVMDSGDALEAVSALRSFKNFMFIIALICLVTVQAAFWMNYLGLIEKGDCGCMQKPEVSEEVAVPSQQASSPIVTLSAQIAEAVDNADAPDAESADSESTAKRFDVDAILCKIKNPTCQHVISAISACNYVLFLAVVLYSLGLLMTLKISIAGRLGGINHITRAFLLSLFVLILTIPWQVCFGKVIVGAIYTPAEMLCRQVPSCEGCLYDFIFYFARFTGLWAIVTIMLILAQIRTAGWSKAVKRRMGIIKPK